jgi:hypothetical protein
MTRSHGPCAKGEHLRMGFPHGQRTVGGLWNLIGRLVDIFKPDECANYFSSCGDDPK